MPGPWVCWSINMFSPSTDHVMLPAAGAADGAAVAVALADGVAAEVGDGVAWAFARVGSIVMPGPSATRAARLTIRDIVLFHPVFVLCEPVTGQHDQGDEIDAQRNERP